MSDRVLQSLFGSAAYMLHKPQLTIAVIRIIVGILFYECGIIVVEIALYISFNYPTMKPADYYNESLSLISMEKSGQPRFDEAARRISDY